MRRKKEEGSPPATFRRNQLGLYEAAGFPTTYNGFTAEVGEVGAEGKEELNSCDSNVWEEGWGAKEEKRKRFRQRQETFRPSKL